MYNFDTIPSREQTGTLKFDAREQVFGRREVIPMWIADMDFECPAVVAEAIRARAAHNVYGYDICGELSAPSVMRWLARRGGWVVGRDWLRFTPGVVAGLGVAIRAFTKPGDGVVIQTPVYPPFRVMIESNDRRVVVNPLRATGESFEIDFEDLDLRLAGARALILCNPHNPVGRVFTKEELRRVGELCDKHGVTIISDEIHSDLVFAPHKHLHIAQMDPHFAQRTITFVAPSKTFNVAGLATSVAVIPSEKMRAEWDAEWGRSHVIEGTVYGHVALRAAYDEGEEWLEALLPYLAANVAYVREFLTEHIPAVKTIRQEGTYLMWLDMRGLGMGHKELMAWLIEEAGLGLNSGADFGREGVGFVRMNVATNRATLERAMKQLRDACIRHSTGL